MAYSLRQLDKTRRLPPGAAVTEDVRGGQMVKVARWIDQSTGKQLEAPVAGTRIVVGRGCYAMEYVNERGKRTTRSLGTTDRRVAERRAREIADEAEDLRTGRVDPRVERLRLEGAKILADHVLDFKCSLVAKCSETQHTEETIAMIERIIEDARFTHLRDLTADRVIDAVAKMRVRRGKPELIAAGKTQPLSARRKNAHITAIKSFTLWATNDDRIQLDPLRRLRREYNEAIDRRLVRRDLLPEEITRLLEATRQAGPFQKMSAADRVMLYRIAFSTGFRRDELESLTAASFDLTKTPPTVTVEAAYSKRKRRDVQPIRKDLADALRPVLAFKARSARLFPAMPEKTADMIRSDLAAARAAWINEVEGESRIEREQNKDFLAATNSVGEVVDFHGTRHTFISAVVSGGASVKVAQELARHSNPTLTIGRYAHTRLHDLTGALPQFPAELPAAEKPKAA